MKIISLGLCTIVLSLLCVTITESTFASTKNAISGNVKNIQNLPIGSVRLSLKGERTRIRKETISDENGFFEFTGLEPDAYKLMVKRKGYMKLQQTVDVEEGKTKRLR